MRPFTDAELQILRQHAASHTGQQIADMIGRSRKVVLNKLNAMGINAVKRGDQHYNVKHSDHDIELCRLLHQEGVPPGVIAEKMEMSRNYVYKIVNHIVRRPR